MNWDFIQYVSDSGRKEFEDWMKNIPTKSARARINERMDYIAIRQQWEPNHAKKLKGYKNIWEIKVTDNKIEYRPLFCIMPTGNKLCLLIGAKKTGDRGKTKWEPNSAPDTAERRRKQVLMDSGRYTVGYIRA